MSEKMGRNILFYSNRDTYSKKILNIISGQKRDEEFVFICVDDRNIQLPSFLKVVPTIFLVREQTVLVDEKIEEHLNPKQSGNANPPTEGELDAYFDSNNGFSSNYSNIDDSVSNSNNSMFSYIQDDDLTGGNSNNGIEGPKGGLSSAYEKMATERQNDFAGIQRV